MSTLKLSMLVGASICLISDPVFAGRRRGNNGGNNNNNGGRGGGRGNNNNDNDDCDCAADVGNGCSASDLAWLNNFGAELPYLVTNSQNEGNTTDELASFVECNFLYDVNYSMVAAENNDILLFYYDNVDQILYGGDNIIPALGGITSRGLAVDTVSFVQGETWLYANPGIAKCFTNPSDGNDYARLTLRSGDKVRGDDGVNESWLSISQYTFKKVSNKNGYGGNDNGLTSCSKKWKVSSVTIQVFVNEFMIYDTNSN